MKIIFTKIPGIHFILVFIFPILSFAQATQDFGFFKSFNVPVLDQNNQVIKNAWTGGLNACQFNAMDLNFDGINDLVVFDRHGNRMLTFENAGISNQVSYIYQPDYEQYFPKINDWMIIADYNGDGLDDIFSYSLGYAGIKVYKNTSGKKLQFTPVVKKYLTSKQGAGFTNILVTYADYPAIVDLDRDGDLDILTFYGLGMFIELHKNMSMETIGNADSLLYEKVDFCWGNFAESPESNVIKLDTCLITEHLKSEPKHTGSTFLVQDLNGDGLDDLLLGDVDYPNVIELINGGTPENALMISQNPVFPGSFPLNLTSFPVLKALDVNNDQKRDLLVSTFDPSLIKSENRESNWLYLNQGSNNTPEYGLVSQSFLQDQMIDVGAASMPVFHDLDKDGLMDIFVGNYGILDTSYFDEYQILQCKYKGKIAYYKNSGTSTAPSFKLMDEDFAGISGLTTVDEYYTALFPAFADLDGDGDDDMLTGNHLGTLLYFENQTINLSNPVFVFQSDFYQQIDIGSFSTPQLTDLTGDGLIDLVIGNQNGTLYFYRNTGTAESPQFTFTTDSLGKVSVRDPNLSYSGYSIPCFFRSENDQLRLIVGSESGKLHYYKDIENNLLGQFLEADDAFQWISDGIRSAPALWEINGDQYPDLILGNYSGGLTFYQGKTPSPYHIHETEDVGSVKVEVYPNPACKFINIEPEAGAEITSARLISVTGSIIPLDMIGKEINSGHYVFQIPEYVTNGIYVVHLYINQNEKQCRSFPKIIIRKF